MQVAFEKGALAITRNNVFSFSRMLCESNEASLFRHGLMRVCSLLKFCDLMLAVYPLNHFPLHLSTMLQLLRSWALHFQCRAVKDLHSVKSN